MGELPVIEIIVFPIKSFQKTLENLQDSLRTTFDTFGKSCAQVINEKERKIKKTEETLPTHQDIPKMTCHVDKCGKMSLQCPKFQLSSQQSYTFTASTMTPYFC